MSKIRGLFFSLIHYAKSTSILKALLLTIFILPLFFVLLIKAIQLFIPFTYIAF